MTDELLSPLEHRLESAARFAETQGQHGHAQSIIEAIGLITRQAHEIRELNDRIDDPLTDQERSGFHLNPV